MDNYQDIIDLDRPISKHPKLSMASRAAQFSPFAALTGYDDEIKETARLVEKRKILDEEAIMIINNKLNYLRNHLNDNIEVLVTYYVKDQKKNGGKYLNEKGFITKIDPVRKYLYLNNKKILINDLYDITSDIFDKFDI